MHLALLLGPGGLTVCYATADSLSARIDCYRVTMCPRDNVAARKLLVTVL